jgi:hypothetical protein
MAEPEVTNQNDKSLLSFLESRDDAETEYCLSRLIAEQTESTIKGIIRSKLRVSLSPRDGRHCNQEALDLVSEAQTALVGALRDLKTDPGARTIDNFHNYVATVTFNTCHRFLRRKYPLRYQLKNKLRYLLTHDAEFALWETGERQWLCGFAPWHGKRQSPSTDYQLHLRDNEWLGHSVKTTTERQALVDLLNSVFQESAGPVALDDLVTLIGNLRGLGEGMAETETTGSQANKLHERLTFRRPNVLTEIEQRARLQKLWTEICGLPLRHRAALLLNLRDKEGADTLALLPLARIATIRQIAEVLAFSPEHFAHVWSELPWDDAAIAKHLSLTRQQVINLRQSARARLARTMKDS